MTLESLVTSENFLFSIAIIILTLILRVTTLYVKKVSLMFNKVEVLEYVASVTHPELLKKFSELKK